MIFYVDTETTGLNGPAIEVAIVSDGHGELDTLIKTGVPVEAGAFGVHGISDAEIEAKGVTEAEAGRMIHGLLKDATMVVAHNVAFDRPRIERLYRAASIPMPVFNWHCTLVHSREVIPGRKGHRLCDLAERFNFPAGGHRAKADAIACKHLFFHLKADIVNDIVVKTEDPVMNSTPLPSTRMWVVGPAIYFQALYTKNDKVLGPVTELKTFEVRAVDFKAQWFKVVDIVKGEERTYCFSRFQDACIVPCILQVIA